MDKFLFSFIFLNFYIVSQELTFMNSKKVNNLSSSKYDLNINGNDFQEVHLNSNISTSERLKLHVKYISCKVQIQINNSIIRGKNKEMEVYDTFTHSDIVRNQYLLLPYPAVSLEDLAHEKAHYHNNIIPLIAYGEKRTTPYNIDFGMTLEAINHFLFNGKYDFRSQFRTLIAGGGTDGGITFMAEQLNHTDSEAVYFDFSKTSMSIAQHRSKFRGWLKIVWVNDWIESIPRLGLRNFDFVVSTGVLHHLKDPQNGLNIINDVQLPHGGAYIMVYGWYGRIPIYWIQTVMKILNERENDINDELRHAKHILDILPKHHFFQTENVIDHKIMGDVGIYDLLLHKRDISFTTQSVYRWLQNSGYNVVDYCHPENSLPISLKSKIQEKELFEKIDRCSAEKVNEVGEIIYGKMIKQDLYVSKQLYSEATLDDPENTMIYAFGSPMGFRATLNDPNNYKTLRNETFVFSTLIHGTFNERSTNSLDAIKMGSSTFKGIEGKLVWPATKFNNFALETLIKKPVRPISISSLINKFKIATNSRMTLDHGIDLLVKFNVYMRDSRLFFLKHKSVPIFPLTCCSYNFYSIRDGNIELNYS